MTQYGIGRAPLKKIEGKRYPVVAEVVVRPTHDLESYALDGSRYVTPQRDARPHISIERDGKQVAISTVALADMLRRLEDPACPDATIDDPDELAFQEELRQWVSAG